MFRSEDSNNLYWAACRALLRQHFGATQEKFPVQGGPVQVSFEQLVGLRKDAGPDSYELTPLVGSGQRLADAYISVFRRAAAHQPEEFIAAYEGQAAGKDTALFGLYRFDNGQFVRSGDWVTSAQSGVRGDVRLYYPA